MVGGESNLVDGLESTAVSWEERRGESRATHVVDQVHLHVEDGIDVLQCQNVLGVDGVAFGGVGGVGATAAVVEASLFVGHGGLGSPVEIHGGCDINLDPGRGVVSSSGRGVEAGSGVFGIKTAV